MLQQSNWCKRSRNKCFQRKRSRPLNATGTIGNRAGAAIGETSNEKNQCCDRLACTSMACNGIISIASGRRDCATCFFPIMQLRALSCYAPLVLLRPYCTMAASARPGRRRSQRVLHPVLHQMLQQVQAHLYWQGRRGGCHGGRSLRGGDILSIRCGPMRPAAACRD